jgi:hypothetical protein
VRKMMGDSVCVRQREREREREWKGDGGSEAYEACEREPVLLVYSAIKLIQFDFPPLRFIF